MARELAVIHPDAHCELDFTNAFELLVATVLSAQTTDKMVNKVTPTLFARYPGRRRAAPAPTGTSWRRSSSRPASSGPRRTRCSA